MQMSKYKNLLINMLLFMANAAATKLVTFVLVPLYTTYMSAGEYGLTDMSLTVISLLTPLVTLDVAEAAVRFIVGDRKHGDAYTAISVIMTALSVVIVLVLTPILDLGVFGGLGEYKTWFVIAYATSALMNTCGEVARGMGEVRLIPVCAGVSSCVTLASAVLLIAGQGMGVTGYFVSVSVGPLTAIVVYFFVGGLGLAVLRGFSKLALYSFRDLRTLCKPMFLYAFPLIPNSLFWWLGTSINRFFISSMLGIAASGMFAAASKVPNLLNTAYSIFQQAWQLSAFQESDEKELARFFSQVYALVQVGITLLCAVISFFAPCIASFFLRGETYAAWEMIPPLLLSNLLNIFSSFYGTVYTTTMHTSFIMRTTVLGAILCMILTPLFIPFLGVYGACVASVIGQGAVFLARAFDSRKYLKLDVGWRFLVPTLALLMLQAVAMALDCGWGYLVSGICLAGVIVIQIARLFILFSSSNIPELIKRKRIEN